MTQKSAIVYPFQPILCNCLMSAEVCMFAFSFYDNYTLIATIDGLILCKLINDSVPDTIDTRVLNLPNSKKPLNAFQITENNNVVITSSNAIGCSVGNIGASHISDGREYLIFGLIWQIIPRGLLSPVLF